jgi:hypothetical protein
VHQITATGAYFSQHTFPVTTNLFGTSARPLGDEEPSLTLSPSHPLLLPQLWQRRFNTRARRELESNISELRRSSTGELSLSASLFLPNSPSYSLAGHTRHTRQVHSTYVFPVVRSVPSFSLRRGGDVVESYGETARPLLSCLCFGDGCTLVKKCTCCAGSTSGRSAKRRSKTDQGAGLKTTSAFLQPF